MRVIANYSLGSILLLSAMSSSAVNLGEERLRLDQAVNHAIGKEYREAFQVVQTLIADAERDKQKDVIDRAYSFLLYRPLIANEALAEIRQPDFTDSVCTSGFDPAYTRATGLLESRFGKTADSKTRTLKAAFLRVIKADYGTRKADACESLRADTTLELRVTEAASADMAAAQKEDEEAGVRRSESQKIARTMERLQELNTDEFCSMYGDFLRMASSPEMKSIHADRLLNSELSKRKLNLDKKLVLQQKVRLGMSECSLYASWGAPDRSNRSVGSWGVHAQLIYGRDLNRRTYVYLKNGTVSSFQD